jgi:hypothetical protein
LFKFLGKLNNVSQLHTFKYVAPLVVKFALAWRRGFLQVNRLTFEALKEMTPWAKQRYAKKMV